MGTVALSLPEASGPEAAEALVGALRRWGETRWLRARGRQWAVRLSLSPVEPEARWSGPAQAWATVTPLALDGRVDPLDAAAGGVRRRAWSRAERLVRRSALRALGRPAEAAEQIEVVLSPHPMVDGALPVAAVGSDWRGCPVLHAYLWFPWPVEGPLVLGRGRHQGLGLCVPVG